MLSLDKTVLMLYDASTQDFFCTVCADGEPLTEYDATSHALGKPHNAEVVVFHRRNRIPALSMTFNGVAVSGGSVASLMSHGSAWETVGGREALVLFDCEFADYYYCMECADGKVLGEDPPPDGSHYIRNYDEDEMVGHVLGSPHHAKTVVVQKVRGYDEVCQMLEVMWRSNAPDDPPSPAPRPRTSGGGGDGHLPDSLSDLARLLADKPRGRRKQ